MMRVVDLFCGGGGASIGIHAAGLHTHVAVDHDKDVLALHRDNFPGTEHHAADLVSFEPIPCDLLWASPPCTSFSRLKGAKARCQQTNDLLRVPLRWAKTVRPSIVMIENVVEALKWEHWTDYIRQWRSLGYIVGWRTLTACDYGAPTSRKRLFLVARCDGRSIRWPDPTHGPGLRPYRTARECIDWDFPALSIFAEKTRAREWARECRAAGYRIAAPRRPLARSTYRQISAAIREYMHAHEPPIERLIYYYGNDRGGTSVDKPLRTVTTRGEAALIQSGDPTVDVTIRMLQPHEIAKAQGFPESYRLSGTKICQIRVIGNSVSPPVVKALIQANASCPHVTA